MVNKSKTLLINPAPKKEIEIAEEHTFKVLNEPELSLSTEAAFLMEQFTNGSQLTPSEFAHETDLFLKKQVDTSYFQALIKIP